jgi:hypothetical protein
MPMAFNDHVLFRAAGGHDDGASRAIAADAIEQLRSPAIRQIVIQKDAVKTVKVGIMEYLEGLRSGAGANHSGPRARIGELAANELLVSGIIFRV